MPIAALLLAAGLSSRMGAFKPLLPFGGRTLVAHMAGVLRAAGLEHVHVVTGCNAAALLPELERLGVVATHNADYRRGMCSSVQAGIAALRDTIDAVLVLPVDLPLLRPSTVRRLLDAADARAATILYPNFRGARGHPPLIRRALFADVLAFDGGGGLQSLLARHESEADDVAVFDRGCLADMDRHGDYAALAASLAGHALPDAEECEAMLEAAATPQPTHRHGRAVADLAASLACRLVAAGESLDPDLVRAAAHIHDIAKGRPDHAEAGAAIATAFGFPELAAPIARHMEGPADGGRLDETAIVYLADKLVHGEVRVSLESRFAPALARFADNPAALAGAQRRFARARSVRDAIVARIGGIEPPPGPAS